VNIAANQTIFEDVFPAKNLVTISFIVVPVPFTDRYEIVIEQTFETHVPVPVLVLDPVYREFLDVGPGFSSEFISTLTNHGLVAVENVTISSAELNGLRLDPLITYLPKILPDQSIQIPYRVSYNPEAGLPPGLGDYAKKGWECFVGGTDIDPGDNPEDFQKRAVYNIMTIHGKVDGFSPCLYTKDQKESLKNILKVSAGAIVAAQVYKTAKAPGGAMGLNTLIAVADKAFECLVKDMTGNLGKKLAKDKGSAPPPELESGASDWFFGQLSSDGGGGGGGRAPYSGMSFEQKKECQEWIQSGGGP
jgi:hypothetical protein